LPQAEYLRTFKALEVQQTFYQPPRLETLARWRATAPQDFEFSLKAWQLVTHDASSPTYRRLKEPVPERKRARFGAFRPTEEVHKAWRTTLECARALGARVVVFQCPASFAPTGEHAANLRAFFRRARREAGDLVFAWEPRGAWPAGTVKALCAELGLVHATDPFKQAPQSGPRQGPRYFRLHGNPGYTYRYRYSERELEQIAGWCRGETYVMFNNDRMAEDAPRLLERLGTTARR
jgi:uncharacterized protein YecE (DUF72 family)